MGSGCFRFCHFCHLNTDRSLLAQSLFLELPLSLCACTQVEMFNKIVERKAGHPALSVQVQVMPCAPSASAVRCAQFWVQTLGVACLCQPTPTLSVQWPGRACAIQGFSPSVLIMGFCKRPVVFLFLNQVFFFFYVFPICTLI